MVDIIDNRNVMLSDKLNAYLAKSNQAHFAVGYFFLSGLEAIAPRVRNLLKLRLLIGPVTSEQTIHTLSLAHRYANDIEKTAAKYRRADDIRTEVENISYQRPVDKQLVVNTTVQDIRTQLGVMDQTSDSEKMIDILIKMIEEGRLEVKVYTPSRLHAKAYIFDYKKLYNEHGQQVDPTSTGGGIVGSSNLSLAGIQHNAELNVSFEETGAHKDLTTWFDALWKEAQPFDAILMQEMKQSWVQLASPYDVYMKTMYSLVKDRLNESVDSLNTLLRPSIHTQLADFQEVAVHQAIRMIRQYNGAFVADVVGLGKSFIGAAIVKHFRQTDGVRPLIICPPPLIAMWRKFNEDYELDAEVLSMGELSNTKSEELLNRYPNRNFVLIDESHNLRNPGTDRYKTLQTYLRTRGDIPCCLLTATPRNKSAADILHQMRLFHPLDTTSLPIDPPLLSRYFKLVDDGARSLPSLLSNVLVRRTRSHVIRWYGFDSETDQKVDPSQFHLYETGERRAYVKVNKKNQFFPARRLKTIEYSIEQTYNGLYERILRFLNAEIIARKEGNRQHNGFTYARYGLWNYIDPAVRGNEPYRSLVRAGANLRGLIRVLLFKRFESSVAAFRVTLQRMLEHNHAFLRAVEGGIIPAGEDAQKLLGDFSDDDDTVSDSLISASQKYDISAFDVDRLTHDLAQDIHVIELVLAMVEPITPEQDAKLQRLQQLLIEATSQGKKHLIFTQYADTALYLHQQLNPDGCEDITVITSANDSRSKSQLVARFSPKQNASLASGQPPIDTVIATDVLSEGLNMQDCNIIINYDLHWNPVRLIQRFGRIDRIGTEHEEVFGYNFLPETELERTLGLREKLQRRIREIHETIGEDSAILDPSEQLNPESLYALYEATSSTTTLGWEGETEQTTLIDMTEAEEILRALQHSDTDEFNRIKNLPDGIRSRITTGQRSTFALCRAGEFMQLYWTDSNGEITVKEASEALNLIASEDKNPASNLPGDHNVMLLKIKQKFADTVKERISRQVSSHRRTSIQNYIARELGDLHKLTDDPDTRTQIDRLLIAFVGQPLFNELNSQLNQLRSNRVLGATLLDALDRLYTKHDLGNRQSLTLDNEFTIPHIVCSEAQI